MVNARDAIYPDEYNGPGRFFEKKTSLYSLICWISSMV